MTQADTPSTELAQFRGQHTDPMEITAKLEEAQRQYHLVSPAPAVAAIPDGCAVAMSTVLVDQAETYALPGSDKVGLGKPALDRIASAVGVSWDPRLSGRLDDGKDPRFVHYRVVGRYRHFDGSMVTIQGEKIMDMRDGSPEVEGLQSRAKAKNRSADQQVREIRMHLLSHAETKARLRAIRSLGIRTGYTPQELRKPFVVAKLQLTGQFKDPAERANYNKALTSSFLGASDALYGSAAAPLALPHEPTPPVGRVDDRDEEERIDPATGEITTQQGTVAAGVAGGGGAEPDAGRAASPATSERPETSATYKIGAGLPGAGKTFAEAGDDELLQYVDLASKKFSTESAKWTESGRQGAQAKIAAAHAEIDHRMNAAQAGRASEMV